MGANTVQLTKGDKNSSIRNGAPMGNGSPLPLQGMEKIICMSSGWGGEAEKITDVKCGVGNYDWSHDGNMIAFVMTDVAADKEEKNKKAKNDWYFMDEEIKQNQAFCCLAE